MIVRASVTTRLVAAMIPMIGMLAVADGAPPVAEFTLDASAVDKTGRLTSDVREGYVSLSWTAGEGDWAYELQSAPSAAFADPFPRYAGRDSISFISGLEDGDHYFRVRARATASDAWGPWSDPVIVPVKHHSLTAAWWLFGLGAALFGLTVAFIVENTRRVEAPEVAHG